MLNLQNSAREKLNLWFLTSVMQKVTKSKKQYIIFGNNNSKLVDYYNNYQK